MAEKRDNSDRINRKKKKQQAKLILSPKNKQTNKKITWTFSKERTKGTNEG